jgi:hypothetical protein
MLSSEIHTHQWETSDDTNLTSINSLTTKNDSILVPTLLGPLAAPVGWRSEIIDSNSPIPTDDGIDLINTKNNIVNNYEEYNTTNTFNTSQIPSRFLSNNIEYINATGNENSFHQQQQSRLTEQQQRNIVNIVESQYPPPLVVRKKLPNNLVTYQQNVSVRYLQPPTPPPPGPIVIRK